MAEKKPNGVVAPKRAATGGISKMAAVRTALAELGGDALPVQIQKFVKQRFGTAISTDVISTYKADIRRKARQAKPVSAVAKRPVPTPPAKNEAVPNAVAASQVQRVVTSSGHPRGIPLHDIAKVKALIGRIGAHQLKGLIEVLDK